MERPWTSLRAALGCALFCAGAAGLAAAEAAEPPPPGSELAVGSAAALDLAALRRVARQLEPAGAGAPSAARALTLEQAIEIALSQNLQLQIAALDVASAEPAVTASEAFFDPSAGLRLESQGTKLDPEDGDPEPRQAADFRNDYRAAAFVRQQAPTGGSVTLSAGYFREDRNDPCDPGVAGDPGDCPLDPQSGAVLGLNDPSTSEGAGFLIELRQPLLRGGRTFVARRQIRDAELGLEIERARLAAQILEVRARAQAAYFDAVLAERLIEVIAAALARDRELVRASQALFDAGQVHRRDLYSAELRLASDRAELARRRTARALAQHRLREVLGLPPDQAVAPGEREIPFRAVPLRLPEWLASARQHRPELLELRQRLAQSALELRVRGNALLPQLDLVGRYGRSQDLANRDWLGPAARDPARQPRRALAAHAGGAAPRAALARGARARAPDRVRGARRGQPARGRRGAHPGPRERARERAREARGRAGALRDGRREQSRRDRRRPGPDPRRERAARGGRRLREPARSARGARRGAALGRAAARAIA